MPKKICYCTRPGCWFLHPERDAQNAISVSTPAPAPAPVPKKDPEPAKTKKICQCTRPGCWFLHPERDAQNAISVSTPVPAPAPVSKKDSAPAPALAPASALAVINCQYCGIDNTYNNGECDCAMYKAYVLGDVAFLDILQAQVVDASNFNDDVNDDFEDSNFETTVEDLEADYNLYGDGYCDGDYDCDGDVYYNDEFYLIPSMPETPIVPSAEETAPVAQQSIAHAVRDCP